MMPRLHPSPLISAIMPAYNEAAYIGEAISSIQQQTVDDWELVIVDDGSTDDTAAIVQQFDDPRIRYIYQENQGRGAARNTALAAARGAYIAITDADDIHLPHRFEKGLHFLETHQEVDVVSGQIEYFSDTFPPTLLFAYPQDKEAIRARFAKGMMAIVNGASLIRREVFEKTGPYAAACTEVEDLEFFLRAQDHHIFAALPDVLLHYRSDPREETLRTWIRTCQFIDYSNYRHRCWQRNEPPKPFEKRQRQLDRWAKLLTWDTLRFLRFKFLCHRILNQHAGAISLQ